MPVGAGLSGGIIFSHSEQYGFQTSLVGSVGGGLAIGAIGKLSLGGSYSSDAKKISDVSGKSRSRSGGAAYGPYGGSYSYSESESGSVSHGISWTPGLGAEYRDYETSTVVLPWKIQIGGTEDENNGDFLTNNIYTSISENYNYQEIETFFEDTNLDGSESSREDIAKAYGCGAVRVCGGTDDE